MIDYAPNGSLRERYPKGSRLPLEQIITYTKQVASALQYAHNEKLIHRDVKPENMLVGRSGEILLSDFGISIVAQTSQSQRTQEVIGSVPYMAPEQLQGHPRSASDQYALGIVVYEWLCGSYPFQGSFTEVYGQHLFSAPPPLHEKNPAVPADIEQVVTIALAKDPHQRFSSVQAFAHALEQAYQRTQQVTQASTLVPNPPAQAAPPPLPYGQTLVAASPSPPSHTPPYVREPAALSTTKISPLAAFPRQRISRRTLLLGLAGLAVAGAGGTAWYTLSHRYPPQGTLIYTYRLHSDKISALAWHGERIASASDDGTAQIWDATTGNNPHVYRGHKENNINALAWSPDGSRIASASNDDTVQVWDAEVQGQALTYTGHSDTIYSIAWSSDSQYLASGSADKTVRVWNLATPSKLYIYKRHTDSVYAVTWGDSHHVMAPFRSGKASDTRELFCKQPHRKVRSFAQKRLAAGGTERCLFSLPTHLFSPRRRYLPTGGRGKAALYNSQKYAPSRYTTHTHHRIHDTRQADGRLPSSPRDRLSHPASSAHGHAHEDWS
ncbi:MAG: serine/threonine protein kinase [Ktedonobacteraceae bacterium]|nr:serine/threonine protein kinase [Ktedonobacteraceae bacterium]